MHYILFVWVVLIPGFALAESMPPWVEKLQPSLGNAVQQSPSVLAALADIQVLGARAQVSRSQPDPVLSAGVQAIPTDLDLTGSAMTQVPVIGIRQQFSQWGAGAAQSSAWQYRQSASQYSALAEANAQAAELASIVFQCYRVSQDQGRIGEILQWYRLLLDAIEARYRSGDGLRQAAELVQVQMARLRIRLSALLAERQALAANWRGETTQAMLPVTAAATGMSLWLPPEKEVSTSPEIQAAQAGVLALEKGYTAAQRQRLPAMFVEAAYGFRGGGRTDLMQGRVGMSLPLWGGGSGRASREVAAGQLLAGANRLLQISWRTAGSLTALRAHMAEKIRQLQLYQDELIPRARAARDSAASAYRAGQSDIEAVVTAVGLLLQIQLDWNRALQEQKQLEADYLAIEGSLVAAEVLEVHP